jgi:hypothetical protein
MTAGASPEARTTHGPRRKETCKRRLCMFNDELLRVRELLAIRIWPERLHDGHRGL